MILFIVSVLASVALAFGIAHFFAPKMKMGTFAGLAIAMFCLVFVAPKLYRTYGMDDTFTAKLTRIITPNEAKASSAKVTKLYFKTADDKSIVVINDDSLLRWKWNSADFDASEIGKTYTVSTYGMRFGIFSMFPNVLDMEVVSNGN